MWNRKKSEAKPTQSKTHFSSCLGIKVVFAVGGTGGHLFPAQALADELWKKDPTADILFAGAHLNTNRFFDHKRFCSEEVMSATPFGRNPLRACFLLLKGIKEGLDLLKRKKPDLVIGFGSYHGFPLLLAALFRRIPYVLFEADAIPGKVNRLFSRYAQFTAVHVPKASQHLKGKTIPVCMPCRHQSAFDALSISQAREFLNLNPEGFTLFVFGGSQGAQGINRQIPALLKLLKHSYPSFQLIHITGNAEISSSIKSLCEKLQIPCYVKEFEPQMGYLWKAASLIIGRAGASTLFEMIRFEVPGILIPYPHASDAHQHINAQFLENTVKGGLSLLEEKATAQTLFEGIGICEQKRDAFIEGMRIYKNTQTQETLGKVIYDHFATS